MNYISKRLEDFIAAFVTAAIGAFIIFEASNYSVGTLRDMGPGYFPMILGGLMVLLALLMAITAQPDSAPISVDKDQLRGTVFVAAAFIGFGLTVERAGMLVSVFLAVFLSAMASRNNSLVTAAILGAATAVVSVLIFRIGLGLQIKAY